MKLPAVIYQATVGGWLLVHVAMATRRWREFTVPGKTFDPNKDFPSFTTNNICECKALCLVQMKCKAWSAVNKADGTKHCHLTDIAPYSTTFQNHSDAVYGFMLDSLEGILPVNREEDGLYYFIPNDKKSILDARTNCKKIPGFRLAIFKTIRQFVVGMKLSEASENSVGSYKHLLIDLQKSSDKLEWGDGTQYPNAFWDMIHDSSKANMYITEKGIGSHEGGDWYYLCQGRNDDQVW
ncbi:uncharacterized protein [Panulirus ornatus]